MGVHFQFLRFGYSEVQNNAQDSVIREHLENAASAATEKFGSFGPQGNKKQTVHVMTLQSCIRDVLSLINQCLMTCLQFIDRNLKSFEDEISVAFKETRNLMYSLILQVNRCNKTLPEFQVI